MNAQVVAALPLAQSVAPVVRSTSNTIPRAVCICFLGRHTFLCFFAGASCLNFFIRNGVLPPFHCIPSFPGIIRAVVGSFVAVVVCTHGLWSAEYFCSGSLCGIVVVAERECEILEVIESPVVDLRQRSRVFSVLIDFGYSPWCGLRREVLIRSGSVV